MKKIFKRLGVIAIGSVFVSLFAGCKDNSYDPAADPDVCIYGPPEMFEESIEDVSADDGIEVDVFIPEENETPLIYGPPEMFEDKNNQN